MKRIFKYIGVVCVAWLIALLHSPVSAQGISLDRLDGVLAGMGVSSSSQPDFDAVLAGMGANPSSGDARLDGVLAAMSITNALDFLDNAYSESNLYTNNPYLQAGYNNPGYYPTLPGSAVLPITGRVTSRFGFRPSFGRMHKGIDIALQVGDTIVAAIDGRVERVSWDPKGYGLFVCIRHNDGLETRYAHLSSALVTVGSNVVAGEPIALGGNTGNSTGPHLHFETRLNGTALDPSKMFDFSMPGNMRSMRNLAALDASNPTYGGTRYQTTADAMASQTQIATSSKHTYIVKTGDTIATVAKKNGISVLTLCRLNSLSSTDQLQPGRMLRVR